MEKNKSFRVTIIVLFAALLILAALFSFVLGQNVSEISADAATITSVGSSAEFNYTGSYQTFTTTYSGYYTVECYGAQGGNSNGTYGRGGYTKGTAYFPAGLSLYVYVGAKGSDGNAYQSYCFNGGGGSNYSSGTSAGQGGGATDVRLSSGSWDNATGLRSRIMVAGGGGGHGDGSSTTVNNSGYGYGGGINGGDGNTYSNSSTVPTNRRGQGGTQTAGGAGGSGYQSGYASSAGSFGKGGFGGKVDSGGDDHTGGGGGGGYYGGGGAVWHAQGGGGSSFISGMDGCNAVTSSGSHSGSSTHYSEYAFYDCVTTAGQRAGNGYCKITYVKAVETISSKGSSITYSAVKHGQVFYVSKSGWYTITCKGGAGADGTSGGYGYGATVTGKVFIRKGVTLYVFVGSAGANGGFNGGGSGGTIGGGGSDVRLNNGAWYYATGLRSRIIVAGGGGAHNNGASDAGIGDGGRGGLTAGGNGYAHSSVGVTRTGYGGTQTAGGQPQSEASAGGSTAGGFGYGGNGSPHTDGHWGGGGGGGWYGGGGSRWHAGGGGGSSYVAGVSGYTGVTSSGASSGNASHYSGYSFTDYSGTKGNVSGDGSVVITLTENTVSVALNNQSATSAGSTSVTPQIDEAMPSITVPSRTGYSFGGYYTGTGGSGTQYLNSSGTSANTWTSTSGTTLYAKWTPNTYSFNLYDNYRFNANGSAAVTFTSIGSGTATYDANMPSVTVPTRTGYTFLGFYDEVALGKGTQYIKADGTSARTCNFTSTKNLYAHWQDSVYNVVFNANGGTAQTGIRYIRDYDNGSTGNQWTHLGEVQAWTFDGVNKAKYPDNSAVKINGSTPSGSGANIVDGNINTGYGGGGTVTIDLGAVYNIEYLVIQHYPDRVYFGTKTEVSADGVNWSTVFDSGSTGYQVNGARLYAEPTTGHKIYIAQKSSSLPMQEIHVGHSEALRTNVCTRTNYDLLGWSTSSTATTATYTPGQAVTNLGSAGGTVTLYAVWRGVSTSLTINPNGGSYGGSTSNTTINSYYANTSDISIPTRTGYDFTGWTISQTNSSYGGTMAMHGTQGGFSKTNMVESGVVFTRYSFNIARPTGDNWYSISFPAYTFTAGHTYEVTLVYRTSNVAGTSLALRHARMGNDWACTMTNLSTSASSWTTVRLSYTMQAKSVRGDNEYDTSPRVEFYTGNLKSASTDPVKYTVDIKNIVVTDKSNNGAVVYNSLYTFTHGLGTTLTATWAPHTYTVVYNANKPSNATASVSLPSNATWTYDSNATLGSAATLTGWTFGGWYKEAGCTTSAGGAGASLTKPNYASMQGATVNLYAKWTANTYNVAYNGNKPSGAANNVSGVPSQGSWTYDSNATLGSAPTLTGWTFGGWYKESGCTNSVGSAGASLTKPNLSATQGATVTLYAKWTLTAISVTSQPTAISKTYDGNNSTLTYTVSHALTKTYQWYKGDSAISGATSASFTVKTVADSGSYKCKVTVTDAGSTVTSTSNATSVSITAKTASFGWTAPSNLVYTGSAKLPTAVVNNLCGSDTCKVTVGVTANNDNINVGSFTFTATALANANYALPAASSCVSPSYTITPKTAAFTWTAPSNLVYTGTAKTPAVAVNNLCGSDTCSVTIGLTSGKDNVNVGSFTFTATALGNNNYALPAAASCVSDSYTITPKTVSFAWTAPSNLVYTGTAKTPTVAVSNLCGSDTCSVTAALTNGKDNVNVGSFTFTVSAIGNGNYALPAAASRVSPSYSITQKTASFTWTAPSDLVYTGTAKTPTVAVSNLCGSDTCSVTAALTSGKDNVNVGSFTFTVSAIGNGNYALPAAASRVSPSYTITQKTATFTWTAPSDLVYTGTAKTPTVAVSNLCGSDTCTVTAALTSGKDNINVGAFTFTASALGNGNYALPAAASRVSPSYTITQKTASFTWTAPSNLIYTGTSKTPSVAVNNLCGSDTCSVTAGLTNGKDNVNVGSFTFTVSAIGNGNYALPAAASRVSPSYTITPKTASFTWTAPSNLIYTGTAKTPTVAVSNLCGSDTCEVTAALTSDKDNINVGSFTFTVSALGNSNYALPAASSRVSPSYTIDPKSVAGATVALGDPLTYNGSEQEQGVNSVTIDGLSATFTVSGNRATNMGEYTLTVHGTGNFCGSQTKTYEISPMGIKDAVVTLGAELTYNGSEQTKQIVSVMIGELSVAYTVTGNKATHAGDYEMTLTGTGDYGGTKVVAYRIEKKALTVRANNNTITYGDAPAGSGITYVGLVSGDTLSGTLGYDYSYARYGDIGEYTITPKGLSSDDYEIGFANGVLTVVRKAVEVTVTVSDLTYGETVQASAEFVEGSIVNNDDVPILLTYVGTLTSGAGYAESSVKPTQAGEYTVWAKLGSEGVSKNYSLTDSASFTIYKATYAISDILVFEDGEFVFDGREHGLAVRYLANGTTFTVTYEDNGRTNVGTQTVTAKFSGYDVYNYNTVEDMTAELTVTARNIAGATITLGDALIYNGQEQTQAVASVRLTITIGSEEVVLAVPEFATSENAGTDAGDYELTVTASGNFFGTQTAPFAIGKKNIFGADVTLGAQPVYNSEARTQEVVSVVIDGLTVDIYEVSDNVQTDVGADDYVLTVTAGGQNFTGTATKAWNVAPKDVAEAVVTLGEGLTYNGEVQTQVVTSVVVDDLTVTYELSGHRKKNAGTHVLTVTGTGNFAGSVTKEYTIEKKALTIKASDCAITYGDMPANDGVSYAGFVGSEDEDVLGGEAVYTYGYEQYGDVGTYTIYVSGITSDNYDITFRSGRLRVGQYAPELIWDDGVIRYTGARQRPILTVVTLNGDVCEATVTAGGIDAGEYEVEVTELGNGNYKLPDNVTCVYRILPKLVDPPLASTEVHTYTGKEQTYRFDSETESYYTVTGTLRTMTGTQYVEVDLTDKENYCWSDTEDTEPKQYEFTIHKKPIALPTIESKPYNGSLLKAEVPKSEYYEVYQNDGGTDVGIYDVILHITDEDCAWAGTEEELATCEFRIVQAENIWSTGLRVDGGHYGGPEPIVWGSPRFGAATAITLFRLQSKTDDDYTQVKPKDAGEYYVLVTVPETENYTALSARASFVREKADIDIGGAIWTYTEPFTYDGTEKRISVTGLPKGVTAELSGNVQTNAGKYTAEAELIYDKINYNEISLAPCSWTIDPKGVDARWMAAVYVYNGSEQETPYAWFAAGAETIALTVEEADGKVFKNVGEYRFTATSPNGNYVVTGNGERSYSISKKAVRKPEADATEYYCTTEEQTYGVVSNDDYAVENGVRTEAGSQEVTVGLRDKDNTEWSDGTLDDITFTFTINHRFSERNGDPTKVVKEATCTERGVYYAECVCGEHDEYIYGEPLGHAYVVEYAWHEGYTATASVHCDRCDYTATMEATITSTIEGTQEYFHATVVLDGKAFTDTKRKGAAVYREHIYDYPVWNWEWVGTEYETSAVFNACDGSDLVEDLTAAIVMTETEKELRFEATVYFGDTNKEFKDQRTVNKVALTMRWTADNVFFAYVRPGYSLGDCIGSVPTWDDHTLYALMTDDGVYLPYTEEFLTSYKTSGDALSITAKWRGMSAIVVTAKDEEGTIMEDVFFSLKQNGVSCFEGNTNSTGQVTFGRVPFGLYDMTVTFGPAGRPITRSYTLTVDDTRMEKTLTLARTKVSTEVIGALSVDNLEDATNVTDTNATVTLILDTTGEPETDIKEAMDAKAESEDKGHVLFDYFDLAVTEKTKTVDQYGGVNEESVKLKTSEEPLIVRLPIADDIYAKLAEKNCTTEDIIVYICRDAEQDQISKLPKKEYAHDSQEYYYVETVNGAPYVVLSANKFVSYAIGIQNTVVQAVNDFLSLAIENWVYGKDANSPSGAAKYGTVKYLYAAKGSDNFTETVPTKAGTYLLKAYVDAEEEYSGLERVVEFVVEKATYNMRNVTFRSLHVIGDGSEHSVEIDGELPEGVYVVYEGNVQSEKGEYVAVAHFYGDSENYNIIDDRTATIVIEDQTMLILKKYWWAFLAGGAFVLLVILVPILRPKGKGGGTFFNYRIGG